MPSCEQAKLELPSFYLACSESISILESCPNLEQENLNEYLSTLHELEGRISVIESSLKDQIIYIQRQISIYGRLNLFSALKRKVFSEATPELKIPNILTLILKSISNFSRLKFVSLNMVFPTYLILINFKNERN